MPEQPQKLDLRSMDVTEEKKKQLKQLFPEVFREDKIDFDHLKRLLEEWVEPDQKERFGLNWPGKAACMKVIQQPSIATLRPDREESVNFDDTGNLFIEGDNLEVLKLLQKSYFGKVKMIYIDPPYNTGNEFIYPDDYTESLDTYLRYTGQKDEEGNWQTTNKETEGRFHSKWLNMMYPRLFLAKNLLREDGVIFISIDDHEMHHLRKVCDDLFGEENFVEQLIWKKRYGGGAKEKYLVNLHEYVLMYAKNKDILPPIFIPNNKEFIDKYYTKKDEKFEKRGPYRTQPLEAAKSMGERKNLVYGIPGPDGITVSPKRQWLWSKKRTFKALKNNELEFNKDKDGNWTISIKQYLRDEEGNEKALKVTSIIDDIYTQHGTKEIENLFGNVKYFQYPKPSSLIFQLAKFSTENEDIVLDFFAGSCTTAHAVLDLNKDDGDNRRFMMVQLPEPIEDESEAKKTGFYTVADIGKERIRRVINQIKEEQEEEKKKDKQLKLGEDGSEEEQEPDLGFKVFKLTPSNFKVWEAPGMDIDPEELQEQLEAFTDHLNPEAEEESILQELILKSGFPLTAKVEIETLEGKKVYSIEDQMLLICLETGLTFEVLDAMAEKEPQRVICLDNGFTRADADALKTNAVQLFKSKDIEFRTV